MVDPQNMRDTLRFWASGVSVVTTMNNDKPAGMTASAFNSLSLDPPQIVVCLHKSAYTAQMIQQSGTFAISLLSDDQRRVSELFAGRIAVEDISSRFNGLDTITAITGPPILSEAIAWLDCEVAKLHDGDTHWIIVGKVLAAGNSDARDPLIYFNRGYHQLGNSIEPGR